MLAHANKCEQMLANVAGTFWHDTDSILPGAYLHLWELVLYLTQAELFHHVLRRGSEADCETRPLIAEGSILHTDTASTYMQLHRCSGKECYRNLQLWVTQVRHSRKKDQNGNWLPVQFCTVGFCLFRT